MKDQVAIVTKYQGYRIVNVKTSAILPPC